MNGFGGHHLIIGIPGTRVTRDVRKLIVETMPAGIILFSRNCRSPHQIRTLIRDIRELRQDEILIGIDHEGGPIQRLDDVTSFPGNLALGRSGNETWAYEQGRTMALELRSLGFNLDFAPVLDLLGPGHNPAVAIRSLGAQPKAVGMLGCSLIRGLQDHGLIAAAKHFPGLGAADGDPHDELPVAAADPSEIRRRHLIPFTDAIRAGVKGIMTSHVMYPCLDALEPATFSRRIVTDLLRSRLGFDGIIMSDDLEMGAMIRRWPPGEAAVRAVKAGHDLVLMCHQPRRIRSAFDALNEAYAKGALQVKDGLKSLARIRSIAARKQAPRVSGAVARGSVLARKIAYASVECVRENAAFRAMLRAKKKVRVWLPDFREIHKTFYVERRLREDTHLLQNLLKKRGIDAHVERIRASSVSRFFRNGVLRLSQRPVVVFCFDAHRLDAEGRLLAEARQTGVPCAVILLRNPHDVDLVPDRALCIQAYGSTMNQIERAIDLLCAA